MENEKELTVQSIEMLNHDELKFIVLNKIYEREQFKQLVKENPNDMELGRILRNILLSR